MVASAAQREWAYKGMFRPVSATSRMAHEMLTEPLFNRLTRSERIFLHGILAETRLSPNQASWLRSIWDKLHRDAEVP